MSNGAIPSDAGMRAAFAEYAEEVFRSWHPGQPDPPEGFAADFDRWIEAHDKAHAKEILVAFAAGGYGFQNGLSADGMWVITMKDGLVEKVEEYTGSFTDGFQAARYFENLADAEEARKGEPEEE